MKFISRKNMAALKNVLEKSISVILQVFVKIRILMESQGNLTKTILNGEGLNFALVQGKSRFQKKML